MQALTSTESLNQFCESVIPLLARSFGASRASTNAGHFEPALVRADGAIERLAGGGPPLGMFGTTDYSSAGAAVHSGDLLVLFTDGFTDLRNASDEWFGEERILRTVQEHRNRPLKEIASLLLSEGMSFSVTPQPKDDLTLFLVSFR